MALPLERLPSLTGSDSGCPSVSSVATPSDRSPFMIGQHYSIPIDGIALQQPNTLDCQHAQLSDISDPSTAGRLIREVCCIGAGYVGTSRAGEGGFTPVLKSYRRTNRGHDCLSQSACPSDSRRSRPEAHQRVEKPTPAHPRTWTCRRGANSKRRRARRGRQRYAPA